MIRATEHYLSYTLCMLLFVMRRTNLYLDPDKLRALKMLAVNEEASVSDLVREAIDALIEKRLSRMIDTILLISAAISKARFYATASPRRSPRRSDRAYFESRAHR